MCLADGTHREHIQLVKVDALDIAHVDGRAGVYTEHAKHVKNTQFEVRSWQVTAFDWLCFFGQVCYGELNGSVLSTT